MTKLFLLSLWLARFASGADAPATPHVGNFGQVSEALYRGAMPSDDSLSELKAFGINMVLDLREDGSGRLQEKQKLQQLGIRYAHVPMRNFGAPTTAEIQHALALILSDPAAKVFVHCLRGKDRTGTVIACYRIQHDGWDNRRALQEAKDYGMSHLERAMQSFIMHFTPLALPTPIPPGN